MEDLRQARAHAGAFSRSKHDGEGGSAGHAFSLVAATAPSYPRAPRDKSVLDAARALIVSRFC
ncbi:hypothetical protein CSIRO_2888 [Bradyrhizobiaceae bacterium SG-6C]|nr:hypothetical protein CSIRO_2888 [Bradyrhizobiaceae bacterium SG-6C]